MVYGLILENELFHLKKLVSEKKFHEIMQGVNMTDPNIEAFKRYPENLWTRVGKKCSQSLGITEAEFFEGVGSSFVKFVEGYKFDRLVRRIGRQYREFVLNLDNVHHYLGKLFIHMKAPSFFVESETPTGLILIYRSKRRGYCHYTIGQMKEISKVVFNIDITMVPVKQEIQFDTVYVKYKLEFDNKAYTKSLELSQTRLESSLAFKAFALFEVFPFAILFNDELKINVVGNALKRIIPNCVGKTLISIFRLERPLIELKWDTLLTRTNNVFEFQLLASVEKTGRLKKFKLQSVPETSKESDLALTEDGKVAVDNMQELEDEFKLMIKGQLMFIEEWRKILFLGCPVISNLKIMIENGLFISDMSTHDFSRDIMMSNIQKTFEKKMTDDLAEKTLIMLEVIDVKYKNVLEENGQRQMVWIPKTLIPEFSEKSIKVFDDAVLLYAKIYGLDEICQKTYFTPAKFIDLLDNALSAFDHLAKKNNVIRIETISGYIAAGGLKEVDDEESNPANQVATLALDLKDAAEESLRDPSLKRKHMVQLCIAIVEGPVVAAVVGPILPKFCLIGPSVTKVERYADWCPPGNIIMSGKVKNMLVSSCRYSNAPTSVNEALQTPVYILASKQDHIKVPMAPVLKAYAKFKQSKIQHAVHVKVNEAAIDEEDIMAYMAKKGRFCNSQSPVCNIL